MTDNRARAQALTDDLRQRVGQALDSALAIDEPAGTSPAWQEVLSDHGVPALDPSERQGVVAAQRPLRGAPVLEFRKVLDSLCRSIRLQGKKIDTWDDPHETQVVHERLMRLVERIPEELTVTYRGLVLPKRQGMFANVLAHHDPSKPTAVKTHAHAMRCKTCGGPRIKEGDFTCGFCDNPMV